MTSTLYILRDLPGVAELEARLQRIEAHPNPNWAPDNDGLEEHADRVCRELFGLTEDETFCDYEDIDPSLEWPEDSDKIEAIEREWEQPFRFLYREEDDISPVWAVMGWDVCDADGQELRCLGKLARAIVCAVSGRRGRLPGAPITEAEASQRAEEWGGGLAEQARAFQRQRRPGRD